MPRFGRLRALPSEEQFALGTARRAHAVSIRCAAPNIRRPEDRRRRQHGCSGAGGQPHPPVGSYARRTHRTPVAGRRHPRVAGRPRHAACERRTCLALRGDFLYDARAIRGLVKSPQAMLEVDVDGQSLPVAAHVRARSGRSGRRLAGGRLAAALRDGHRHRDARRDRAGLRSGAQETRSALRPPGHGRANGWRSRSSRFPARTRASPISSPSGCGPFRRSGSRGGASGWA